MIEHVYSAVARSPLVDSVIIATCDQEIADVARQFGAISVMTASTHERATDRCREAVDKLAQSGTVFDLAVMVQGDEPMTHPDQIEEVVRPFHDSDISVSNLCLRISEQEADSPDVVKVVLDQQGRAMYFSRSVIPGLMGRFPREFLKQLGLIAFRTAALNEFSKLEPTPHERAESVDMLRFLEHGVPIQMVETAHRTIAVDTPADLERVKAALKSS